MQEGNRVTGTLRALWGMARPTQLLLIFGVYGFGAVVAHAVHQTVDWTALRAGIPRCSSSPRASTTPTSTPTTRPTP
ncbi:hypothetical protein ACFQH2_01515 [Natronoarchaeum sp. GCM10025703]|uniref:hypothetical protein n=1 Tax=Natronoarchaeum sp. GCM10025703 TaxID=3252685 RepID=UPI0036227F34